MIKQALNEFAQSVERQFNHDRQRTVGASEIGQCARKIAWVKSGIEGLSDPGHQKTWGAHLRGTLMEQMFWEPALRMRYGQNFLYAGSQQRTIEDGKLSATPDGLICGLNADALNYLGVADIKSDCILVECKTIDPRVNLVKERDANHFQVQVQLGLVREMTEHKPVYAVISYIDASFWDDVDEFPVEFDEDIYKAAKQRAAMILSSQGEEMKPEGWIAGGSECEYCPFTKICGVIRRSLPEREAAADPQFVAEVSDLCRDVVSAENEIEVLEREVREVQQQIKDRLRAKSVRKIPGVVTWSPVKGRKAYDNKKIHAAVEAAGIDIEQFSTVGDPTDRLQISVR